MSAYTEDELEAQLVDDIAEFSGDPLGYIEYAFPWGEPETALEHEQVRDWQKAVCEVIRKAIAEGNDRVDALAAAMQSIEEIELPPIQIARASGHGIGKSAFIAMLIMWALSTCKDTRGIVTANTDTQLRTKTWPELAKWHAMSINAHWFDCLATSIAAKGAQAKNWRIDAIPWSLHNLEAFAGLHNKGSRILLVFDEASSIPDKVWEVAEGALTDADTEIIWLAFGNPTQNAGRFRECFRRNKHRWDHEQIDSRTVPGTNKAKIQEWLEDHGIDSDFFKVRVRGMFPSTSFSQFISTEDVDAAFGKHLREPQYNFAPKIISVDPSWTGADPTVITLRQGLAFTILRSIPKNDDDVKMATLIASLEDEHKADAVNVDAGYGTGIVSAGAAMGRSWFLVWFGSAAPDKGFRNLRSWMWNEVKKWLKSGGAIPKDDELYQELIGPETVPRLDGIIQLESKKDMKDRGLPSPNKADCLAISFARPIMKNDIRGTRMIGQQAAQKYDPLRKRR